MKSENHEIYIRQINNGQFGFNKTYCFPNGYGAFIKGSKLTGQVTLEVIEFIGDDYLFCPDSITSGIPVYIDNEQELDKILIKIKSLFSLQ